MTTCFKLKKNVRNPRPSRWSNRPVVVLPGTDWSFQVLAQVPYLWQAEAQKICLELLFVLRSWDDLNTNHVTIPIYVILNLNCWWYHFPFLEKCILDCSQGGYDRKLYMYLPFKNLISFKLQHTSCFIAIIDLCNCWYIMTVFKQFLSWSIIDILWIVKHICHLDYKLFHNSISLSMIYYYNH